MKLLCHIDIQSNPEKVWYWLATPERAMQWQTNLVKTEIIEEVSGMIGTTYREWVREGERVAELEGVVTDYKANQVLAMRSESKYNAVNVAWRLEEIETGTRLTVDARIRFKGFLKIMSLVLRPIFKRKATNQLEVELAALKGLCEKG